VCVVVMMMAVMMMAMMWVAMAMMWVVMVMTMMMTLMVMAMMMTMVMVMLMVVKSRKAGSHLVGPSVLSAFLKTRSVATQFPPHSLRHITKMVIAVTVMVMMMVMLIMVMAMLMVVKSKKSLVPHSWTTQLPVSMSAIRKRCHIASTT